MKGTKGAGTGGRGNPELDEWRARVGLVRRQFRSGESRTGFCQLPSPTREAVEHYWLRLGFCWSLFAPHTELHSAQLCVTNLYSIRK